MTGKDSEGDMAASARVLGEALPYLQRYSGAIVVVKLGGHAMDSDEAMAGFARDIVLAHHVGVTPVVVHGGGPAISGMLDRLGLGTEFRDGKRVTDPATMEVVEMVLSGQINKRVVQAINAQGDRAAGLSGKDAGLMACRAADPKLGLVGMPQEVDPSILETLCGAGMIPVISPIGFGAGGETYNVNGDSAAAAIAAALKADRLLMLTDVEGVRDQGGDLLPALTAIAARDMIDNGVIAGGMIPKVEACLDAIAEGVRAAVILDGRVPNACLLELFTQRGAGTIIRND